MPSMRSAPPPPQWEQTGETRLAVAADGRIVLEMRERIWKPHGPYSYRWAPATASDILPRFAATGEVIAFPGVVTRASAEAMAKARILTMSGQAPDPWSDDGHYRDTKAIVPPTPRRSASRAAQLLTAFLSGGVVAIILHWILT